MNKKFNICAYWGLMFGSINETLWHTSWTIINFSAGLYENAQKLKMLEKWLLQKNYIINIIILWICCFTLVKCINLDVLFHSSSQLVIILGEVQPNVSIALGMSGGSSVISITLLNWFVLD